MRFFEVAYSYIDPFYEKKFVLKRAKKNLSQKEIKRFQQEYEQMKLLSSPYVTEVFNFNAEKNEYIMEFMDSSLKEYYSRHNVDMKYEQRRNFAKQILKAFQYIHSKELLHRDISPNNILIKKYDDVDVIKISDFGLVKLPDSDLTSENSKLKGCFNDPALETEGFESYNILHETYALTRLIYFIMTGKTNLSEISKTKNANLQSFVLKGTNADKRQRFRNVREMIEFLTYKSGGKDD